MMWFRPVAGFFALKRNLVLLLVATFVIGAGEELWMRFVPKYLQALGATVFVIGLFERHIDQIGEERHLGAVGDQSQPFEQRDVLPPAASCRSAPAHRLLEAGLRTLPFYSALFRADQSPAPPPESLNPATVAAPKTQLVLTALGCFS